MSDNANWMDRLVVGSMCHCDDPDDCFDHWELFVLPPGVEMDDEGHVGRAQTMDEAMLRRLVALAKAGTTPSVPADNGLEPGEIVAVPADLRNDPNGVRWETELRTSAGVRWVPVGDLMPYDPLLRPPFTRRVCRPITEEGQS